MPDLPRSRRPERPSWTRPIAARLTPAIKALVITDALLFFLFVFSTVAAPWMKAHLAIHPDFIARRELWQPLTALFVHFNPLGFVFNVIGLWWGGAALEQAQGTRRFLALFLLSGVLSNIAFALVSRATGVPIPFEGCSLAVLALFVAFGRIYGREQVRLFGALALQAWHASALLVGFALVMDLIQVPEAGWGGVAATLVATAVGYLMAAPGGLRELYDVWRVRRHRRRYRVIEGGAGRRGRPPKYWN
jgi:membrane associated rhomboid family serine protease